MKILDISNNGNANEAETIYRISMTKQESMPKNCDNQRKCSEHQNSQKRSQQYQTHLVLIQQIHNIRDLIKPITLTGIIKRNQEPNTRTNKH